MNFSVIHEDTPRPTRAQQSAIEALREAVTACGGPEVLADVILPILAQELPADVLERLGDQLGRAGHLKGRDAP